MSAPSSPDLRRTESQSSIVDSTNKGDELANIMKFSPELFDVDEFLEQTLSRVDFHTFLNTILSYPDIYLKMNSKTFWKRYYETHFPYDNIKDSQFKGSWFYECIRATYPDDRYYLSDDKYTALSTLIPGFQRCKSDYGGQFETWNKLNINFKNILPFAVKEYLIDDFFERNFYYILLENGDLYEIYSKNVRELIESLDEPSNEPNNIQLDNGHIPPFSKIIMKNVKNIISIFYNNGKFDVPVIIALQDVSEGEHGIDTKDEIKTKLYSIHYNMNEEYKINFENEKKITQLNFTLPLDNIKSIFSFESDTNIFSGNKGNILYYFKYGKVLGEDNVLTYNSIDYSSLLKDFFPIKTYKIVSTYVTPTTNSGVRGYVLEMAYIISNTGSLHVININTKNIIESNVYTPELLKDIFFFYYSRTSVIYIIYKYTDNRCGIQVVHPSTFQYLTNIIPIGDINVEDVFIFNTRIRTIGPIFLDNTGDLYEYIVIDNIHYEHVNNIRKMNKDDMFIEYIQREVHSEEENKRNEEKILPSITKVFVPWDNYGNGIIFKGLGRGKYVLFPYKLYLLYTYQGYIVGEKRSGNEIYFTLTKTTYSFVTIIET